MSNITKNLLMALTLVCVIALIVFCIQLIVQNRGVAPREPGATVSGGAQQEDEGSDQDADSEEPSDGINGDGSTDDFGSFDTAPPTQRPPPQGTRHSIMVTENSRLIIYAREDLFDFEEGDLDWWFLFTGGGLATLEIAFTQVSPQGAAAHAESFLNDYSGGSASEFTGEELIKGSAVRGYHVTAMAGGEVYEAWIHTLDDSDLALVFVINYTNDAQRDALYEVLSTLDFE